ncbi:hypothetical protein IJ182_01045 [bacterium]|nr:hypothetical protein [bacterium]
MFFCFNFEKLGINKFSNNNDIGQYQSQIDSANENISVFENEKTDNPTQILELNSDIKSLLKSIVIPNSQEKDNDTQKSLYDSNQNSTSESIREHIHQLASIAAGIPTLGQSRTENESLIEEAEIETDKKGRIIKETFTDGNETYTIEYSYNNSGLVESAIMSSFKDGTKSEERILTFGSIGNIDTEEINELDEAGNTLKRHSLEYTEDGEIAFHTEYEADDSGNLEAIYIDDCNSEVEYIKQNFKTSDCWLLSTLTSLSYTENGRKIIEDAITQNNDGSYSVYLKGINKTINISQEDLKQAYTMDKYSNGDKDVVLLELAFESAIKDIQNGKIKINDNHPALSIALKGKIGYEGLDFGNMEDAMFLLTGNDVATTIPNNNSNYKTDVDKMLNDIENNPDGYAVTIALSGRSKKCVDINGNVVKNTFGHEFAVKEVHGNYVTLVDPENTSKTITVTRDMIYQYSGSVQSYQYNNDQIVT